MDDSQNTLFNSVLGTSALPEVPPAIGDALQDMLGPGGSAARLTGGLGAGLTAAANNWNKPGLAAFAAGAGGALQGAGQTQQQQVDGRLKAVQAALQAWQAGDIGALRRAQADYYRALAERSAPPPLAAPPQSAAPAPNMTAARPPNEFGAPAVQMAKQTALPPLPGGVPSDASYSPSRMKWRTSDGRYFDATGQELPPLVPDAAQPTGSA